MGDSKWGALAAAEVFALPSHQENFGIAVAEALACGTPVLVSDKVNIWREIKKESAGLVASDTAEGMAGMLRDWVAMSMAERQAFPGRARVCFAKHFDIRGCAEAVLAAVREASHSSG
jgi:glycosyltransferase involved in cell wall biosynthesis